MLDLTRQFCGAFQQAIDNIHLVAKDFERMDNELQKDISLMWQPTVKGEG